MMVIRASVIVVMSVRRLAWLTFRMVIQINDKTRRRTLQMFVIVVYNRYNRPTSNQGEQSDAKCNKDPQAYHQ